MMCLSFSEEFFSGSGEYDLYSIPESDEPASVLQAIISLPREDRIGIARDLFGAKDPEFYVDSEGFPFDVLDMVRETDCCDDYVSPITVYIDPEQRYSVTVYEDEPSEDA